MVRTDRKLIRLSYPFLLLVLLFIPFVLRGYNLLVVNLILVYVILAIGYNLVLGFCGQFSLAQTAFFGIGAYCSALITVQLGFSFFISLPLAGLVAAIVGVFIGLPSLRLGGIYLAMLTWAFSEFIVWIFIHWEKVTFGVRGVAVPPPRLFSLMFSKEMPVYFLALTVATLMAIIARNILNSKIGRAFMAIRDSEVAAHAMGVDVVRYKIMAFALSAFYAGIAGGLYSVVISFVHPDAFGLFELIRGMGMVIIGGLGSILGSILGAVIMVIVPELLREFKSLQEIIYGIAMVVFIIFMPEGIAGLLKVIQGRVAKREKVAGI